MHKFDASGNLGGSALLCETGNAKKLRFFLRGVFDGLRGRMGPLNLP